MVNDEQRQRHLAEAHLTCQAGVGFSLVTRLEKSIAQPGAEVMFRAAWYFCNVDETFETGGELVPPREQVPA
jgi:hypothetical protein